MLLDKSIEFADSAASKKHLNNYGIRAIVKSYIRNEMPHKALDLIETKSASPLDHWLLYRKAEAEMMLGKEDAIATAESAYDFTTKLPCCPSPSQSFRPRSFTRHHNPLSYSACVQ